MLCQRFEPRARRITNKIMSVIVIMKTAYGLNGAYSVIPFRGVGH